MKKILLLILVLVLIASAALFAISRDWQAPTVSLSEKTYVNQKLTTTINDNRALGEVCYYLDGKLDAKSCVNAEQSSIYELTIDLSAIADGEHEVCVEAADGNLYFPNRVSQCRQYIVDKVAPKAVLESETRYMQRGGSAAVFVSTPESETNIRLMVGETRFRFISNPAGTRHFAVFAHPHDVEVADFKPMVEIEDQAGNVRRLLIDTITKDRVFDADTLDIPHSFIEKKSLEMLNKEGSGKEAFLEMNRTIRAESRAKLKSVTSADPSPEPMWGEVFYRNLGSPKAKYAEPRTYKLDGEVIDHQTHFGIDIAGLSKMPIKSASDGIVIFADYVGIYGNCVVVDHGGYVYTLYAHMSQLDVTPGTRVAKEQTLGLSGNTGMAGGDHLHYAIYVSDTPVEPNEWFDTAWMKTRINDIYHDFKAGE
jgi:hypothetical protein